jgi:hypothetical protein
MDTVYAELTLRSWKDVTLAKRGHIKPKNVREVTVKAIVDAGAYTIMIDKKTMKKLRLGISGEQTVKIAGGEWVSCPLTTPVVINWKDQESVMRDVVVPDLPQVLVGVVF